MPPWHCQQLLPVFLRCFRIRTRRPAAMHPARSRETTLFLFLIDVPPFFRRPSPADPAVSAHSTIVFHIIILNFFSCSDNNTKYYLVFSLFSCDFSPTFIRISGNICFVNPFPVNFVFSVFVPRVTQKEKRPPLHTAVSFPFSLAFLFYSAFASICRRLWISSSQISSSLFPSVSMIMSAAQSHISHGACSSDLR